MHTIYLEGIIEEGTLFLKDNTQIPHVKIISNHNIPRSLVSIKVPSTIKNHPYPLIQKINPHNSALQVKIGNITPVLSTEERIIADGKVENILIEDQPLEKLLKNHCSSCTIMDYQTIRRLIAEMPSYTSESEPSYFYSTISPKNISFLTEN